MCLSFALRVAIICRSYLSIILSLNFDANPFLPPVLSSTCPAPPSLPVRLDARLTRKIFARPSLRRPAITSTLRTQRLWRWRGWRVRERNLWRCRCQRPAHDVEARVGTLRRRSACTGHFAPATDPASPVLPDHIYFHPHRTRERDREPEKEREQPGHLRLNTSVAFVDKVTAYRSRSDSTPLSDTDTPHGYGQPPSGYTPSIATVTTPLYTHHSSNSVSNILGSYTGTLLVSPPRSHLCH
ncbi:hypothetical protein B0H14DRAFT_2599000 [Mycena olivaceomarginata]|nr:hypothetical protein B0H14DRAFT_2599000 [Mycena olivaceomarginata]